METTPNTFSSLFWGYTVVWGVLGLYIFLLIRRVGRLEKEIEERHSVEKSEQ